MKNERCPKCNYNKHWKVRRERLQSPRCRYGLVVNKLPLRRSSVQWRRVLRYFMLGLSSNKIASEMALERRRVYTALNRAREVMLRDIPGVFDGVV